VRFHVALLQQEAKEALRAESTLRRALENLDEAVALDPNDVQSHTYRGRTRLFLGDYRGAAADFTRALKDTPKDTRLLFQRGMALFGAGANEAALKDFDAIPAAADTYAEAQLMKGECLLALKKYDAAIEALGLAAGKNAGEGYRLVRLACAYL